MEKHSGYSGDNGSAENKWFLAKQWKNQTKRKLCYQFYFDLVKSGPRGVGEQIPGSLKS